MNTLYYGDNLDILKNHIKDETVDLIYLDPPFQSGKNYNQIFQPVAFGVKGATSQIQAFEDTWIWGSEAEREYTELITGTLTTESSSQKLIDLMKAMRGYLAACPLFAYLCMMAPRLLEMRRTLKSTGSIYLHCDPTASHYLKLIMDAVFDVKNYRNEIVWHYNKRWTAVSKAYQRMHDILLFYSKGSGAILNPIYVETTIGQKKKHTKGWDRNSVMIEGKRQSQLIVYNQKNVDKAVEQERINLSDYVRIVKVNTGETIAPDVWEINYINSQAKECIDYPTQKPEALLERIIEASSNKGDTVLDPFCGCGTAIAVAEKLRRQWIGIDITYLAIDVIKKRLEKNHIKENEHFKVYGVPKDVYSAGKLAEQKPFEFEAWAVSQLNATPTTKTGDKGVDGVINFIDNTKKEKIGRGIISVKGGYSINPGMVRDLKGTIQSQNADFGILITLKELTRGMIEEAVKEGSFDYCYQEGTTHKKIPKIQLLTVEDLFINPIPIILPPNVIEPYRKPGIKKDSGQQKVPF